MLNNKFTHPMHDFTNRMLMEMMSTQKLSLLLNTILVDVFPINDVSYYLASLNNDGPQHWFYLNWLNKHLFI